MAEDIAEDMAGPTANEFHVPVEASLGERQPRTLKHADTFAVFDHNGDAIPGPASPEGIYHRDTRYLSQLFLTVDDRRPVLLSSTVQDDNAVLICDLTNPQLPGRGEEPSVLQDLLHIRRTRFLWKSRALERMALTNFDTVPRRFRLTLGFAADFADIFEVRGSKRARRGIRSTPQVTADTVTLAYVGLDERRRETRLRFEPAPTTLTAERAVFVIEMAPHERRTLFLEIRCGGDVAGAGAGENAGDRAGESAGAGAGEGGNGGGNGGGGNGGGNAAERGAGAAFFTCYRDAHRALRETAAQAASIASSNQIFNETIRRSVSDLYMLTTETPDGLFPYAGIPWFSTFFGRDALITALETLWLDPRIARGVLRHLARTQATGFDPARDAEPGKILHEARFGEMANLGEVPFGCYYGSVDATPLFVMLAGAYLERTGDLDTLLALWPAIRAALGWLEGQGDRDGDHFIEYGRQNDDGLINQGWKDSHDSVFHADGSLARGPIALVEVQAYAYGAWRAAAGIGRRLKRPRDEVADYLRRATELRRAFDRAFWDEELGTYVLALDGEKRPCRIRTSNAGHALLTGLALNSRAPRVVEGLMLPSSFSGWGIRTLATTEARYNPMSYHNGSVWPHDNALIAIGMSRYGFRTEAARIFTGLFEASTYIDQKRLPELFCGFPRKRSHGATFYPVACSPQAWAAAAPIALVAASLGLSFDPEKRETVFDQPVLPDFVDDIALRQLTLGNASIDIQFDRAGRNVAMHVLERRGPIQAVARS